MWWIYYTVPTVIGVIFTTLAALLIIGYYLTKTTVICKSKKKLNGKTAIVTGGTAGMGLEIAKDFAKRGAKVIIACPFEQEGDEARELIIKETGNENVLFKIINLASFASVRLFAEDILKTEKRLDILMNNAGVLLPNLVTNDGINFVMQVNYFGHFLLTVLLLPLLKKTGTAVEKSRIINTSSMSHGMGSINYVTMQSKHLNAYSNSKLCVAMFTRELAKKLGDSHVVVNTVDPRVVSTSMASKYGLIYKILKYLVAWLYPTPWEGAQTAIHVAVDKNAGEINSEYFIKCTIHRASQNVYDSQVSHKLWEESVKLVKLSDLELELCDL